MNSQESSRPEDPTTREAFRSLVSLLQEYTEKLRQSCQSRISSDARSLQSLAWGLSLLAGLVAITAVLSSVLSPERYVPASVYIIMGAVAVVAAVFMVAAYASDRWRAKLSPDAEQTAKNVKDLVNLLSQFSEHASRLVSDRFELKLRMTEAEEVLQFYSRVFGRKPNIYKADDESQAQDVNGHSLPGW